MRKFAFIITISFFLLSCAAEPEPLVFGKDQCHTCKMTLMDKKFGAEVVTKKGKVYKFDDINCLFNFYREGSVDKNELQYNLVIDFSSPEKLIDAEKAYFLISSEIKSPMASQVAAFESLPNELKQQWGATEYKWDDLQHQFQP